MKAEVTDWEKERFKDVMLVVLKMKEGATSPRMQAACRSQKRHERESVSCSAVSLLPQGLQPARLFVHGILQTKYSNGLPFPSAADLSNPGIKSRSSALQEDSLPSEPLGKRKRHSNRLSPKTSRRNAAPLIHLNFWPPEQNKFVWIQTTKSVTVCYSGNKKLTQYLFALLKFCYFGKRKDWILGDNQKSLQQLFSGGWGGGTILILVLKFTPFSSSSPQTFF